MPGSLLGLCPELVDLGGGGVRGRHPSLARKPLPELRAELIRPGDRQTDQTQRWGQLMRAKGQGQSQDGIAGLGRGRAPKSRLVWASRPKGCLGQLGGPCALARFASLVLVRHPDEPHRAAPCQHPHTGFLQGQPLGAGSAPGGSASRRAEGRARGWGGNPLSGCRGAPEPGCQGGAGAGQGPGLPRAPAGTCGQPGRACGAGRARSPWRSRTAGRRCGWRP